MKLPMFQETVTNIKRAKILWVITIIYMGIIFFFSSRPYLTLPVDFWQADKFAHLLFYIPLSFLFYLSLKASGLRRYIFILSILLSSLYGVTDELHQAFVPGRVASIGDLLADSVGAFTGSCIARLVNRIII